MPRKDTQNQLNKAVEPNDLEQVKILIQKRVSNQNKLKALMVAITNGHTKIVQALTDADINKQNEQGETALTCAVRKDHTEIVQALTDADINKQNEQGETPLMLATREGYKETSELLLIKKIPNPVW
ncbi:MAG: ankyrin repeat domain-containing protein [Rickettsiaceae bacterium H1]|nr:ankyrin repeat domain-containing protein [Rickettsiaceae bacterium H1]